MTTICMHGSPLSRINNLDLWQTHDYKALGIVGEPWLDVDFTRVLPDRYRAEMEPCRGQHPGPGGFRV